MVFYLVWLLVGMLGNGIVMQYAIKLVFCLVGSLVFLWLRKGHMYSCGLKKNGMKNLKVVLPLFIIAILKFIDPIRTAWCGVA